MSGHSKWATIRRKKEKTDAARGRMFTRLIKELTIAAKHGGGDESSNPRLRTAVAAAKAANMPWANIEKAIKRGTGELPGVTYEEITYEGYGPGGVAIMMEVLTDNKNRTVAELRHILSRYGGSMGETGCVSWMFSKRGVLTVPTGKVNEDDLMMIALDAGADDMKPDDNFYEIVTMPDSFESVKRAFAQNNIPVETAEVTMHPKNTVKVVGKNAETLLKIMDALEEQDDIQHIYSNFDIDEKVMQTLT